VAGPKASVGSAIRGKPGGGGRGNDSCDNGMGGDAQGGGISFGVGRQTVRQAVSQRTHTSISRPSHPRLISVDNHKTEWITAAIHQQLAPR
jgi:hypothetical protein